MTSEVERHILVRVTPEEEAEIFNILKSEGLTLDGEGIKNFLLYSEDMSPEEKSAVDKFGETLEEIRTKYPEQTEQIKKQATQLGGLLLSKILKG